MIKLLFNLLCTSIIFLILISIPETDGSSLNLGSSFLGSPKKTSNALQNIIWILILIFLLLAGIRTLATI
jgi:protein translocase SecG subunit